jgi:hypothetical protein
MKSRNQCDKTPEDSTRPHVLFLSFQKIRKTIRAIMKLLKRECVKGTYSIVVRRNGLAVSL